MIRIEIEPVWRFRRDGQPGAMLVMLGFLNEIRETGKITRAADSVGLSYRHCWNLIEKWSEFFGTPLVNRKRGSGTELTPFGERLVWAGQRLEARLGPQLQNLSQELETQINQFLPHGPIVRVHASHGFAISALREMLSGESNIDIDLRYVSNQNSLVSLAHGACDLAGLHLPQGELRSKSIAAIKDWLNPDAHRVIGFVTREMGLMVKPGNPLKITSLESLVDPRVRFVNRDPDSGTRLLFDLMLREHGIDAQRINGYENAEFTHAAVAAYVASDMADACFGVEAAARHFDLDFVRLVTEDYLFVCHRQTLDQEPVKRLLAIMKSDAFKEAIAAIPGYKVSDPGVVKTVKEIIRQAA